MQYLNNLPSRMVAISSRTSISFSRWRCCRNNRSWPRDSLLKALPIASSIGPSPCRICEVPVKHWRGNLFFILPQEFIDDNIDRVAQKGNLSLAVGGVSVRWVLRHVYYCLFVLDNNSLMQLLQHKNGGEVGTVNRIQLYQKPTCAKLRLSVCWSCDAVLKVVFFALLAPSR